MAEQQRVRIGLAGIHHGHVAWILRNLGHPDVEVVGIYEPDRVLAERFSARFGFSMDVVFSDLGEMLDATRPTAVAAFGSIFDHLAVVKECAPRGVHVMVEKPLAVNLDHARQMVRLAQEAKIHLLTNFETSWYASTYEVYDRAVVRNELGEIRKIVVHDGHFGPQEIGCGPEFLSWLTDPVLNGGGAVVDFGCYGAVLIPWLMGGESPTTVTAVTQTLKPHIYPKVDDEATIILTYPQAQGIIQGSWNWPVGRKDIEVYGAQAYLVAEDAVHLRSRARSDKTEHRFELPVLADARSDPFTYLAAAVDPARGKPPGFGPSDLFHPALNLTAVRILDAARESARSGKTVVLG